VGVLAGVLALIFAVLAVAQRLLLNLPYWPAAVAGWWVLVEGIRDGGRTPSRGDGWR